MAKSSKGMEVQLATRMGQATASFEDFVMEQQSSLGSKRVTFADNTQDNITLTPSRKPHYSAIRKKWFQYCDEGEYEQLKSYMASCEQKGVSMKDFFLHEGRLILNSAVAGVSHNKSLIFICENVEHNILKQVLGQNDYYVLKNFLLGQSGMDKYHRTDRVKLENRLEKFKLLLSIDFEGVQMFMKENASNEWVSEGVKNSFVDALQNYRKTVTFQQI